MLILKAPSFYLNVLQHFKFFTCVLGSENCHRSMFTIVFIAFLFTIISKSLERGCLECLLASHGRFTDAVMKCSVEA